MTTTVVEVPLRKPRLFRHCFSQEGEDMILASFFEGKKNGFYVEVGAYHPKRYSNTYHFYIRGWRGISIDATPGSMKAFRRTRPEDINIEAAVSDQDQRLDFHLFNEPALNTFDVKLAAERDGCRSYRLLRKVPVRTTPLKALLDQHLPSGKQIDFMSIDVEGLDLAALRSNDWEKYRPTVILVEDAAAKTWELIGQSSITHYLRGWDYEPFASTFRTVLYRQPE